MITSRVTPPAEEEGAEVDGAEGVGGVAVPDYLERSYASLRLTVAVSYGTNNMEVVENGKRDKKRAWNPRDSRREDELITGRRIPKNIYDGKNKMRRKIYSKML